MSSGSKKRDLATNRLLDILRSQDVDDLENSDGAVIADNELDHKVDSKKENSQPKKSAPVSFGKKKVKIPFSGSDPIKSKEIPVAEENTQNKQPTEDKIKINKEKRRELPEDDEQIMESKSVRALRKKLENIRKSKTGEKSGKNKKSKVENLLKSTKDSSPRDMMPKKKKKKDLEDEPVSRIKSATVLPKNASTDKEPHDEGKLTSILQKFDSNNIDEEVINTAKSKLTTLDSKTKKINRISGSKTESTLFTKSTLPQKSSLLKKPKGGSGFVIKGSDELSKKSFASMSSKTEKPIIKSLGILKNTSDQINSSNDQESEKKVDKTATIPQPINSRVGGLFKRQSERDDSTHKVVKKPATELTIETDLSKKKDPATKKNTLTESSKEKEFETNPAGKSLLVKTENEEYNRPALLNELEKITGIKDTGKVISRKKAKNNLLSKTSAEDMKNEEIVDESPEDKIRDQKTKKSSKDKKSPDKKESKLKGKSNLIPSVFKKSKKNKKLDIGNEKPSSFAKISSIFTKSKKKVKKSSNADSIEDEKTAIDPSRSVTIDEIVPESFDSSLINYLEADEVKSSVEDYFRVLLHRFDESWIKLSIVSDEKLLWLLQITVGVNGQNIDKYCSYSLPYQTEDKTIHNMNELIGYVLSNHVEKKNRKIIYGSYFSSQLQSKTQVLETPELTNKELKDLVEWNTKKNLSFPADQAISNWETSHEKESKKKKDVIIGVLDRKSINSIERIFYKNDIKLRLVSTMPILLWKSFIANYPDRKNKCNVLIHIGENHTIVLVINNHKLLFIREIAIGTHDFYKAVMQRVKTSDGKIIEIDEELARQVLHQYGIPKNESGFTVGSNINLYKLSIFLRPIVERITGELGRSLNYFKKQNPDLIWEELVFDGIGATLPSLAQTLRDNLNIDVSLFNPIRAVKIKYHNLKPIEDYKLPNFALNFSLMQDSVKKLNLMPKKIRAGHKNILFSKVASIVTTVIFPIIVLSSFFSSMELKNMNDEIDLYNYRFSNSKAQTKEFFVMEGEIAILETYQNFIKNDRIKSENLINIMKIIASRTPNQIKITDMEFKKQIGDEGGDVGINLNFDIPPKYMVEIKGLVNSDASVANIQLANFRVDLQRTRHFKKIFLTTEDISSVTGGKLLFTMQIEY